MDQASPSFLSIGGREFRWGERTYVMGIVNVTPDSFAGDGVGTDVDAAIRQAIRMREDGADLIDVGGEVNSARIPSGYRRAGNQTYRASHRDTKPRVGYPNQH